MSVIDYFLSWDLVCRFKVEGNLGFGCLMLRIYFWWVSDYGSFL